MKHVRNSIPAAFQHPARRERWANFVAYAC